MKGNFIPLPALTPMGVWDAATNTPTLGNGGAGGLKGYYYEVSVDGVTSIDGIADWKAGDWIWHNGSVWRKANHAGGGTGDIRLIAADETITVELSGGDYTTLEAALASLENALIAPDATVTVQLGTGVWTNTTSIFISHVNGDRIKIVGATPLTTTVTGFVSSSGSIGAYSAIIGVASTANIAVDDFVMISDVTGTGDYRGIMGCWRVTNVDSGNSRITVTHTHRRTSFPTMTLTGGTVYKFPTRINANGCDAFQFGGSLGGLADMVIVGNGTAYDAFNINQRQLVYAKSTVKLCSNTEHLGVANFRDGINNTSHVDCYCFNTAFSGNTTFGVAILQGAKFQGSNVVVSGCNDDGFNFSVGSGLISTCYALGNAGSGFRAYNGARITVTSAHAIGNAASGFDIGLASTAYANGTVTATNNGQHGFYAFDGGQIYGTTLSAAGNGASSGYYGVHSTYHGIIRASTITVSGSTYGDIQAQYQGGIYATTLTGTPSVSPSKNLVGNYGGIIKVGSALTNEGLEVTSRSIYVATTGSDTTGDGSSGAPFFSIHRALKDVGIVFGATITIYVADGVYDYSTLGDLLIDTRMISGSGVSSYIKIKSQSNIDAAFTTEESGTFAAQSDTQSNVHTDASKSWTTDALVGKFVRIKTMNTGTMPSAGDGISYSYRLIPIIRNGTNWLETSFVQGSSTQSQDIATYDIVSHTVTLNMGAKNIIVSDQVNGTVNFMGLKIATTGRVAVGYDHTTRGAHMPIFCGLYNTNLTCSTYTSVDGYIITTFMQVSNYSTINITDGAALLTTYSGAVDRFLVFGYIRDTVMRNTGASKAVRMMFIDNELLHQAALQFRYKCINIKYMMNTCDCLLYGRIYFDTVDWMVDAGSAYNAQIIGSEDYPLVFANEPTLGRATNDGVTEAKTYFDIEANFNMKLIQPSSRLGHFSLTDDGGYAIRMLNDSGVTSIKGMLASPSSAVDSGYIHTIVGATDAYGVVAEAGITDGAQAYVVKSGRAAVLLENGTAAARGQALVVSTIAAGRVKAVSSPATGVQVIGIADNDVTAGTDKLVYAQLAFRLDRAYTASDILTNDDPVKTVQQKLDELSAAGIEYMDVGINVWNDGAVLSTGSKGIRQINWNGEITAWTIIGDVPAGSIVMDVKKSTYAGYPTTASIAGTDKPTLSGAQKNTSTALTGWTKAIAAGDVLEFVIDSVSLVQKVWLILKIKRTV